MQKSKDAPFLRRIVAVVLMVTLGLTCYHLPASAQSGGISVKMDRGSLSQLISQVERQSDYTFYYETNSIDVGQKVSVNASGASIESVLSQALGASNVSWSISGKKVLLYPKGSDANSADSQQIVRGRITDNMGEPVVGAYVMVNGTSTGTITDENGNFSLKAKPGDVLTVTSLGFQTRQIPVTSYQPINVVAEQDIDTLDEVVVIGYGTARKADLTGSTSSLSGEKLQAKNNPNISSQLQGQVAGLQVTRSTGEIGSGATLRIRGVTTMSTNDPLVIIDGVPGSLDYLSPEDIKDIQVLKDAASAAIYGSRAAAGVILVTTKRARTNEFKLGYTFEYGIDKATEVPKFAGAVDWMNGLNELAYNDGASDLYSRYSQEFISSYAANHISDPDSYPDTDWMSEGLKKTTHHQKHSLTLSGGTKKLRTNFSLNYYDANALYMTKNYKRYTVRMNNDYDINDWIHASVDVNLRYSKSTKPRNMEGTVMQSLMYRSPLYNAYWSDGEFADGKDGDNPIAALALGGKSINEIYYMTGKVQLDLTPLKGLTLTAMVAPNYYFNKVKTHHTSYQVRTLSGSYIYGNTFGSTYVSEGRNDSFTFTSQLYANYKRDFGKHNLNLMAGYEGFKSFWESLGASRSNYTLNNYPYLNLGPADYQYNNGSAGHNAYRSLFARLMYSYDGKYLFQANVRRDGSSRFSKNYRWGTFPSVSAGWVISKEPWFNVRWMDFLKLRASVGQLGNERIGSEFPYQSSLWFGTGYIPNAATGGVDIVQTAYQPNYAFEDITWETTTTYGVGVDMAMLGNRLRFTGDIYKKKTKDMLMTIGFPSYFGYNSPEGNAAEMTTKGWDIELSWNDHIGEVAYGASFNLSDYRSKMGYMADKNYITDYTITEEGSYYQEWYLYKNNGIILNEDAMTDASGNPIAVLTSSDKPGCIQYVDQDGDGVINASGDRVKMGNSLPELLYGGSVWAQWKNLDFNLSFQGVGHQQCYWSWPCTPYLYQAYSCPATLIGNHWSPSADDATNAKAKYPMLTTNTTNVFAPSDFYLFNGAYMRIKDITLGYTLPSSLTRKVKINKLRVYASINDLPAFSKYPKGYDPEWNRSGDLIMTSFIFGVNVTL